MKKQIIENIATYFYKRNLELEIEDLLSVAGLAYLYMERSAKRRGKRLRNRYVWQGMSKQLITFCNKQKRVEPEDPSFFNLMESPYAPADEIVYFKEMLLDNLSRQALEVVKLIFNSPAEFIPLPTLTKRLKRRGWQGYNH